MKLIVGLGNPGEKYINTRHNLGFKVIEHFLKDFQSAKNTVWEDARKFKSEISQIEWQRRSSRRSSGQASFEKVILAKPQTYMNNSGLAIKIITDFYKISADSVWIIHDDIDLPLGSMKIRFGGASGGHHGVESVLENLATDKFWRFRMGIGTRVQNSHLAAKRAEFRIQNKNVEDYVLGNFVGQERGKLKDLIKRGVNAIETSLEDSLEKAMNRFNNK
ncbi:MAG: aminoacyl-tRNA hydrolase [Candidatus Levybacteria bacterium]|nr:aminoacyl-tRNA hydrolase [Candidatus Levybacteria bacterium]